VRKIIEIYETNPFIQAWVNYSWRIPLLCGGWEAKVAASEEIKCKLPDLFQSDSQDKRKSEDELNFVIFCRKIFNPVRNIL